ncbi:MAG: hypothetical protein H8E37_12185, partial [Planctomycetes bacterium]|nr:hypothetical protein [Planctomycetota bacterium]
MKNVNWKELLITHAEKGVLGVAGLIVLVGLATTSWGTYDKQPDQFEDGVTKGRTNFGNSTWPTDRKAEFEAEDPGLQVVRLFDGARTYAYSTRWVLPLNKSKERIKEPNWFRFETVVADAGKILMEMLPPPEPMTVAVKSNDGTGESKIERPKGVEGPKVEGPRVEGPRQPASGNPGASGATTDSSYDALNEAVGSSSDGMSGQYGQTQKRGKAKGTRFAAIRAVFPLKKQVEELKRAMNLDSPGEAYQELIFWDFELERQTAVAGPDPWKEPWEKVDIKYALDLLSQTDFDVDVVDERFREAIFTMPLPFRVTGNWGSGPGGITNGRLLASHPRIKQVLTTEQREETEKRNAALIAAAKRSETKSRGARGGFGPVQHDTKSLARSATQSSSMMNSFREMMQEGEEPADAKMSMQEGLANPYGGGGGGYGMQGAYGLAKVTEISELLLFRFLDFSVVPGNAYRYRVKLKLQNPNFGREVSDIDPGHLVAREGEFRITEWSEPSVPAIIQDETDFYVAKVDERRGATIDVHEWMGETGSYVNGRFEGVMPGDQIARWREEGRKGGFKKGTGVETAVLRPYEESYDDEVIDFVTPNTLVDLSKTSILNPADHPELELTTTRRMNVALEEIVMINRFGELVQTDSVSQQAAYKSAADLIKDQEEVWAFLRERAQATQQSGIESLLEGSEEEPDMSEMMQGMGGMGMGSGERSRSSTKR